MAEAWTHVYQVPNYPPETGLQGSIPRGTCSKCGCLRFISELGQSSRCICPHQWHHHQPQWLTGGVDEIPTAVAMSVYRAGRHQTNDCVGYFPSSWPPARITPCVCGETLNMHEARNPRNSSSRRAPAVAPPILAIAAPPVAPPQPPGAILVPQRTQPATIRHLPDNLLLEIFTYQVFGNANAPQPLMRVCRSWHSAVTNSPSLVDKILLTDCVLVNNLTVSSNETENRAARKLLKTSVICRDRQSLVRAIERIRGHTFELHVLFHNQIPQGVLEGLTRIRLSISQRCRSLSLLYSIQNFPMDLITELAQLERLEIHHRSPTRSLSLNWLFSVVEASSFRLRQLIVHINHTEVLYRYSPILLRVHSLSIQNLEYIPQDLPCSGSTVLRQLNIGKSKYRDPTRLDVPLPALEVLKMANPHSTIFQPEMYTNLLELMLVMDQDRHQLVNTYHLPSLIRLTLIGSWSAVSNFQAPNLYALTLRDNTIDSENHFHSLSSCDFRPKRLDVDLQKGKGLTQKQLRELLEEKWDSIEELRVVYLGENHHLDHSLTIGFIGRRSRQNQQPICPRLRELSMLFPLKERLGQLERNHLQKTQDRFSDIVNAQARSGILHRYKFYSYTHGDTLEDDSDEAVDWQYIN